MKYHKERTKDMPIQELGLPESVSIPLSQHIGKICQPRVKVGDRVLRGEQIASCESGFFAPIHSSISGEVTSIKNMPHPSNGSCLSVQIKSDAKDEAIEDIRRKPRSQEEVDNLSKDTLGKIILDAGIVGMGGAAFPTHIKLKPPKPVDTFILNAAECEPYLTSDYRLMIENPEGIISGMKLMLKILGTRNVYLAIEDNKPEAIKKFKSLAKNNDFKVCVLKTVYPQGGEKQLTQSILAKEVPAGGLPFDIGVVVQNVATAFAVYEAVYLRKPLYERVVTVCGSALANPKNLRVRIGTSIRELIAFCAPLQQEVRKIIIGGPMMGIAQSSMDVPIIKASGGVILFSKNEVSLRQDRVCCRCARCVDICPARIEPAMITIAIEKEKWDMLAEFNIFDCIECGLCSYICPAKRDLVHLIRYGKERVKVR
ncbi:MAG: electron transport complex subunit RsxC [Candidatus Omnitrophica bacterium]|nr:electron transport complex subunit RsxC [Candidatus Omnitrophota bacterium]